MSRVHKSGGRERVKEVIRALKRDDAEHRIASLTQEIDRQLERLHAAKESGSALEAVRAKYRLRKIHRELTRLEYFPHKGSEEMRDPVYAKS